MWSSPVLGLNGDLSLGPVQSGSGSNLVLGLDHGNNGQNKGIGDHGGQSRETG
jgi:hypothetical protein